MQSTSPLHETEKSLHSLKELCQKQTSLSERLVTLSKHCREQRWLTDGSAETVAADIFLLVGAQQKLIAQFNSLSSTENLSQAQELLSAEVQRLKAADQDKQIFLRFCALETTDANLAQRLPAHKAHMKALMMPDASAEARSVWLRACGLLLEQLEAPDSARTSELLSAFRDTIGVEFLAGLFGHTLSLSSDWESEEQSQMETAPVVLNPIESGFDVTKQPKLQSELMSPVQPNLVETSGPKVLQERPTGTVACIVFAGPKRNQEPSGKRLNELLKNRTFQDLLDLLLHYVILSDAVLEPENEEQTRKIAGMVQDGYLTKAVMKGEPSRTFYQASHRLSTGLGKQSIQPRLRKARLLGRPSSLPEAQITAGLLEQVWLIQQVLLLLQQDKRLAYWEFGKTEVHTTGTAYQIELTFHAHYSNDTVSRRIVSLEGVEDRETAQERLVASTPIWTVVRSQEEIPAWSGRLTPWELPLPEWIALDAPQDYFLPDGTRRSLTELFPPAPALGEMPEPEEKPIPAQPPEPEEKTASESTFIQKQVPPPPAPTAQKEIPEHTPGSAKPKPRLGLFVLDKPEMDFEEQAAQWAAGEKFPLALYLLRAAAESVPELYPLQKQLAYALDDPMEGCEYQDDLLSDIFAAACEGPWGEQETFQALRASAYLRMAFSSSAAQQSYQIADSLQGLSGTGATPSLSSTFHLLSQFVRTQRRGVDRQIIRQVRQQGDVSARLKVLSKEAREDRGRRWNEIEHKMERIKLMFDHLFGGQGTLMHLLEIIADQRTDCRAEVKTFCADNQLISADGTRDQTGIIRYIDRVWQTVPAKRGKNSSLAGTARTQAINRMTSCVDVCAEWLELTEGSPLSDTEQVDKQCNQLMGLLDSAQKELAAQTPSGSCALAAQAVLSKTLADLTDALQGKIQDREDYFIDFLYTGHIELDENFCPVLEQSEHIIPGFEPWERLRRHDEAMTRAPASWDAAVARILGGDEEQPDYRNFGSAQLILQHCEKHGLSLPDRLAEAKLDDDDRRTSVKVQEQEERFRAELELAATYGQIEDNTHKERLVTAITKQQRDHFDKTRNWGSYFLIMRACLAAVRVNAEHLEPQYRYEFDQLKQTMDDCPLFEDIERLLKQKMFSVAHDYIQLAKKENITEAPQGNILQQPWEKDSLRRFLEQYTNLQHRSAEKDDREPLFDLARSLYGNELGEEGDTLLRVWPQNGQADAVRIKALFKALNFPVDWVAAAKGGRFQVKMRPSETGVTRYPHPIAVFGTELSPGLERGTHSGLDVYVLNGKKTVDELEQRIGGLRLDSRPTIFLLNWSIPLAERRELAKRLKKGSIHPTAIVLDRVLMLFLARCPLAERTQALLQCALPFHFCNPYTEGNVSPEMFMGRDAQLGAIVRSGQANIIYGGRQLGKTALLRRAASLVDDRANGRWAIYTDKICRLDYTAALTEVYDCLCRSGFLEKAAQPQDWLELCNRIQARMDRKGDRVERFLLLLDEADRFLESSSSLSYRPVECLYQLETSTQNRFKFVLAGLHNVMRFSRQGRKNNSVLGKLDSLTIKPLTFQEASQLLEQPLYYLGFRMKPEQDVLLSQILLSANYYPGLIQFYCRQLVDSLKTRRASEDSAPPYWLDEGTIRNLLQKEDFVEQIHDKFFITLDVEEDKLYYRALAYALAYCYYDASEDSVEGYTFEQIRDVYEGFEIRGLCQLEAENVKTLLSEMEDLNVLVQMDNRYSFNGANFRHMMGDEETVMNELDRLGGEEQ